MKNNKPFTRDEMKILVFNKMKSGMSYENACKELKSEVDQIILNNLETEKKEKAKEKKQSKKEKFNEDFKKLKNGK